MVKRKRTRRRAGSEAGVALLIAIVSLLLISVVAISMIIASGTETSLSGNYRSSASAYYAAMAGLEEARGRLLPTSPSYFGPAIPSPFPLGQTVYVLNRLAGEPVVPWDSSNPYFDAEYQSEFGVSASSTTWRAVNSVWDNNAQGIPGPVYKWVRINAATEAALHIDVNYDGNYDGSHPLYYDSAHVDSNGNPAPSLILSASPPSTAAQALEITAMAYLPNGSQKYLQYVVAPLNSKIIFPAALILDGFSDSYAGPNHNFFQILGNQDPGGGAACLSASLPYPVAGIGVPDASDVTNVINGIPTSPTDQRANYTGTGPTPSVASVGFAPNLQTVKGLDELVQNITQNADAVITGPADQTKLPSTMSASNPMTVVIAGNPSVPSQGDFNLTAGFTGYGLLLVTGNFTYTPEINWNGVILVIGQGTVTSLPGGTSGLFRGAMLIAQTRDSMGNLLAGPNPGPARFNDTTTGGVGQGIFYDCQAIVNAEKPLRYKVLSFREIPYME
jgi:hypothetical protein